MGLSSCINWHFSPVVLIILSFLCILSVLAIIWYNIDILLSASCISMDIYSQSLENCWHNFIENLFYTIKTKFFYVHNLYIASFHYPAEHECYVCASYKYFPLMGWGLSSSILPCCPVILLSLHSIYWWGFQWDFYLSFPVFQFFLPKYFNLHIEFASYSAFAVSSHSAVGLGSLGTI